MIELPPGIQNINISPDQSYIAVSTRQKFLYIFSLTSGRPNITTPVAKMILTRVSNRLRFSDDSRQLLIADKTGDCFLWKFLEKLNDETSAPLPVCGHLSMVMDVLFTAEEKALVTCDRDEKIRVTSFPDTHNLLSYCMGHKEYVAQVELVPHNKNLLISISGDQTLRFWDFLNGKEIFQLPLSGPGASMTCWATGDHSSMVVCSIYQSEILQIFEVQSPATENSLKLKSSKEVAQSAYHNFKDIQSCGGSIWTLTLHKVNGENGSEKEENPLVTPQLEKFEFNVEDRNYNAVSMATLNDLLRKEFFEAEIEDRDDVAVLFKKRVNNIVHYHERKRKRIEEKSK